MTIKNPLIVSAILHLALFLSLYLFAATNRSTVKPVSAAAWVIDLTTALAGEDSGHVTVQGGILAEGKYIAGLIGGSPDDSISSAEHQADKRPEAPVPAENKQRTPQHVEDILMSAQNGKSVSPSTAESPDGPGQTANIGRAFMNIMNMQAVMMKIRQYLKLSELTLKGMLEASPALAEKQKLEGCSGTVTIIYGNGDRIDSVSVKADNKDFRMLLKDSVQWDKVPPPKNYLLPYTKVTFIVRLENGRIAIGISPI
jgi:hypothetical protein